MYTSLVSNLKSFTHSCTLGTLVTSNPFSLLVPKMAAIKSFPSYGLVPAPPRGRVYSFTPFEYMWALVTRMINKKQWKWHSLTFKSRSKETLLSPESLEIIALEYELPCNECDCPETTILGEALPTLRGPRGQQEMPRNTQAPYVWVKQPSWKWTLQSQSPPLSPNHPAEPFSNSWPTKPWGKIKSLF